MNDLIERLTTEGYEQDGAASPEFSSLGDSIRALALSLGFRKGVPEAHDEVANQEFEKAQKTIGWEGTEYGSSLRDLAAGAWERGRPQCESPIEKMLLPWLICQQYPFFDFHPSVLFPGQTDQYVRGSLAIIPQLPIGRYRVDFALAGSLGGLVRFVVVECDGREFHDGVDNVKRDVHRDVAILANKRVLDVLRFDGRDILRAPQACAGHAAHAVREAWRKGNPATAQKFEP